LYHAIYAKDVQNYIRLAKPTKLLAVVSNPALELMGSEIETKLIQVIEKSK